MGAVGGDFTTTRHCRVRVLPVERDDDADALLNLTMVPENDDREVSVLLTPEERLHLIEALVTQP